MKIEQEWVIECFEKLWSLGTERRWKIMEHWTITNDEWTEKNQLEI